MHLLERKCLFIDFNITKVFDNMESLVQQMAWHWTNDKPLPESTLIDPWHQTVWLDHNEFNLNHIEFKNLNLTTNLDIVNDMSAD